MTADQSTCGGCQSALDADRSTLFAGDSDAGDVRYALVECLSCGLVCTHPQPSAERLREAYRSDYYGPGTSKFVTVVERWTRYIAHQRATAMLAAHGHAGARLRILDIGCGRGVLIDAFRSMGHEVVGVERVGSPFAGVPDVVCGDLGALGLPDGSFDVIVLWHVLEHLDQPELTLQQASRLLVSSGSLFISVPNFGSRQSRWFRSAWFHLDLPRHLFHFTDQSLQGILQRTGFAIREKHTFAFDQNLFGFVQSTLNRVPSLPHNHFYRLLSTRVSIRSMFYLIAYMPLVAFLSLAGLVELMLSNVQARGACLTIMANRAAREPLTSD